MLTWKVSAVVTLITGLVILSIVSQLEGEARAQGAKRPCNSDVSYVACPKAPASPPKCATYNLTGPSACDPANQHMVFLGNFACESVNISGWDVRCMQVEDGPGIAAVIDCYSVFDCIWVANPVDGGFCNRSLNPSITYQAPFFEVSENCERRIEENPGPQQN